jgi:hypothetical protein
MKSFDYEAMSYQGDIYCVSCLPAGVGVDDEEVYPVFADSEWECYPPTCCVCGYEHDYVNTIHQEEDITCKVCGEVRKGCKGCGKGMGEKECAYCEGEEL